MCFIATSETDGNIYCATRAKRNTSSPVLFSNIGWKATVRNASGTILQEIYYKMDGNYLKTTDIRTGSDGYEYSLYVVSLSTFKSRLNQTTLKALESGNCDVTFDACIIIKYNGSPSGGMTDNGISWGTVYTTYNGIINAEQWSTVTQNSLLTYYDKEVEGLFYTLTLNKDSGIASVTGAGKYCYGTVITFWATPKSGYDFAYWSGTANLYAAKNSVTITKNLAYTANSKRQNLTITYYRNWDSADTLTAKQTLYHGVSGQTFTDYNWKKTGYYQTGWKHNRSGLGADYEITNGIGLSWINTYIPKLNLYANWSPNRYTICFDANGDEVENVSMQDRSVNYESVIKLPQPEYVHPKATFLGWSQKADDFVPQFRSMEEVQVAVLAREAGVENSDGARIVLYAVWDKMPAIDVSDIYVSLENAKKGKVTEQWLFSFASASDKEDGVISYGVHEKNSFVLLDYDSTRYTEAGEEGAVMETFSVTDSSGNVCTREIRVYLVDTSVHTEAEVYGNVRFISSKYFMDEDGNLRSEEEGGLGEESIWRCETEFLELLERVLGKRD